MKLSFINLDIYIQIKESFALYVCLSAVARKFYHAQRSENFYESSPGQV